MQSLDALIEQTYIDERVMTLRLLISLILAGLIGLERESRRQKAGLRTHILIALGSTLLMLLSIYIPQTFRDFQNGDPGRIAAQVITGIGFLGGGAIFKLGSSVKGLTTAATIWAVAAVGLTVGAGLYTGAAIATGMILFVLVILNKAEDKYFPEFDYKILEVAFKGPFETTGVFNILKKFGITMQSLNIIHSPGEESTALKLYLTIPVKADLTHLYKELGALDRVTRIEIKEDFN